MRILAFSDLHRDRDRAERLVESSAEADIVIAAGDFANQHQGLEEMISVLAGITKPTFLVPGNNETEDDLRKAVSDWSAATVLHGDGASFDGVDFFGLGAGIPVTPWDWSYDLDEDEAESRLAHLPEGAVLILHSPPKDACDAAGDGTHLGSLALREAIESRQPVLALCGHIHEAWGERDTIGRTEVANLGPEGAWFEV